MEEQLKSKIKGFDLETLQNKFVALFLEYDSLKKSTDIQIEMNDKIIKLMFEALKKTDLDKAKKANLRKIILELEATKSALLYKYLTTYIKL